MKIKVFLGQQVHHFIKSLPPESKRSLRLALKALEKEKGDIKSLRERLDGYYRLRVGGYRIIFAVNIVDNIKRIDCLFAERRKLVYEVFSDMLHQ
jgi:mRNA interferase RelE/StbE